MTGLEKILWIIAVVLTKEEFFTGNILALLGVLKIVLALETSWRKNLEAD